MKQVSIALNIILGIILLATACRQNTSKQVPENKTCYQCDLNSFYGLTKKELYEGVARYSVRRSGLINGSEYMESVDHADTRSCEYSLDTLKKFICLIENYTAKNDASKDLHQLGIRFLYAVYSGLPNENVPEPYRRSTTLFMVPTYRGEDYDPRTDLALGSDSLPITAQPLILDPLGANAYMNKKASGQEPDMAKNQGQLCPPKCPTDALYLKADNDYSEVILSSPND